MSFLEHCLVKFSKKSKKFKFILNLNSKKKYILATLITIYLLMPLLVRLTTFKPSGASIGNVLLLIESGRFSLVFSNSTTLVSTTTKIATRSIRARLVVYILSCFKASGGRVSWRGSFLSFSLKLEKFIFLLLFVSHRWCSWALQFGS